MFVPLEQLSNGPEAVTWIVRATSTVAMEKRLGAAIHDADPGQRSRVTTVRAIVDRASAATRFNAMLLGLFAASALILALVGVYGVVSLQASERRREVGIRLAFGAKPASVVRLFLSRGMTLVGIGVCAGAIGALMLTRSLSTILFGIQPHDLVTFIGVSMLMLLVGGFASHVPAYIAARADPMAAIRSE